MDINQDILASAALRYGVSPAQLEPLPGGHFNWVYRFTRGDKKSILRITPPSAEVDLPATTASLAWMDYLATHGAAVPRPLRSSNQRLVETIESGHSGYLAVAFEHAEGLLSETLPPEQWDERLYRNLGQAIGKIHALARAYNPSAELLRQEWDQGGNCFHPLESLDPSQALIQEKRAQLQPFIARLPKDRDSYGMIHADLHFGNIFADTGSGKITIFDFDDCAYGWFVMDLAMLLFDVLVLYPGGDDRRFASAFLQQVLSGYLPENPLDRFWIAQLPLFLKLLEIGVYTQVYRAYNPLDQVSWVGKFMHGRKQRIENDIPYVEFE